VGRVSRVAWAKPRAPAAGMAGSWFFALMGGSLAGVALQLQQAQLWRGWVYAVLLCSGLAALACVRWLAGRGSKGAATAAALACGLLLGGGQAGGRAALHAQGVLDPALEGVDLQVVGVVSRMPQHGGTGTRFLFDVESARWADGRDVRDTRDGPSPKVPARLTLGWYADRGADASAADAGRAVHAGERWRLAVRLKAPHGSLNPHGFDSELWWWVQGIRAHGQVRTGPRDLPPERLAATWRHPVERAREAVRDAVFGHVADRRAAGVVAALVTGDQGAIDRGDWDVFRATGVAHLMAISGLHVTMFAWLAAHAVAAAWRRSGRLMRWLPAQRAALLGGVALAALYALFSGWGVPSQRTVWMLAAVGLLRLSGRRWPWPHVWLLAAALVVAIDPWALMQAGFWLSFVAVGVLFASEPPMQAIQPQGGRSRLLRMLREQWVITLALTPLSLLLFQQVSLVGFLANAVAIPWVTLVVTPLSMLGVLAPPAWTLAAWAVQGLAVLLQWCAALPHATLSMAAPPWWMAGVGVAGGMLLAMRLPWTVRALGLPLLLPALLWEPARPAAGEFELLAADIGQGNAVLVRTATHSLLYDAGPRYSLDSDAGDRVLVPLLRAFGERLHTLVLSHRDTDHVGGAAAVLAAQPQAALLSSIEAGHPLQALRPARRCEAGQRWTWDGVDFEILHPGESDYRYFTRPNAVSCVLRVGNGRAAVLLAGDIGRLEEFGIVSRIAAARLRADVLLVPHHGSRSSSSTALLAAVQPRIALVQAGYRNRFGHPAPEVAARYRDAGARLVESTRCGAARWSSLAPGEVDCERESGARYWHHRVP